MSEDTTKDLEKKYSTKPTIETVLDSINSLGHTVNARIDGLENNLNARIDKVESTLNARMDKVETNLHDRIERVETNLNELRTNFKDLETGLTIRLDRIEGEVKLLHSETLNFRADMRELRHQLNLPA